MKLPPTNFKGLNNITEKILNISNNQVENADTQMLTLTLLFKTQKSRPNLFA